MTLADQLAGLPDEIVPVRPARRLIVGCPIRNRHWILPTWRDHVLAAVAELERVTFDGFIFVAGRDDTRDVDLVRSWPETLRVITVSEPPRPDVRDWTDLSRYAVMVSLRNLLLGAVRDADPDLFLSLDSDMLLAPGALAGMLEVFDAGDVAAVGGKAHMIGGGEDRNMPSFANAHGASYVRGDTDQVIHPDVIMGIKLMDRRAFNVDYRFDRHGEDIGWSLAAHEAGLRFGWDGRTTSKHVFDYQWLYKPDQRVGF